MANSQLVREQQKLRVRWLVEVFGKVGRGRGRTGKGEGGGEGEGGERGNYRIRAIGHGRSVRPSVSVTAFTPVKLPSIALICAMLKTV